MKNIKFTFDIISPKVGKKECFTLYIPSNKLKKHGCNLCYQITSFIILDILLTVIDEYNQTLGFAGKPFQVFNYLRRNSANRYIIIKPYFKF